MYIHIKFILFYRNSDEDEESNSLEVETVEQALGNLQMFDAHNANMSPVQGMHAPATFMISQLP